MKDAVEQPGQAVEGTDAEEHLSLGVSLSLTLLCTFSVSLFCLMPCGCLSYNPAKVMNSIRCRLIKAKLCPLSGVATFKKETHKEISLKTKKESTYKSEINGS